jgi:ATP-binding cassette subfamily B protein/subfamily B ATP-binding cassette protein MsbA
MSVRKQVLDHAVRLPLHRVQELKAGGATSILRQDTDAVGDLVFGMLYNPWRAVIQLLGSLFVLAWVDWRLLLGALVLVPLVFVTHKTWISRIRPQHKRIRAQREEIDALATESFGGIRVVRAFSRQRSETDRLMRPPTWTRPRSGSAGSTGSATARSRGCLSIRCRTPARPTSPTC